MRQKLWSERRAAIVQRWRELVLETYPPDASRFFQGEQDPFANPVGAAISQALAGLYDELRLGAPAERLSPLLDDIIRIRAVQDFSPSQAVGFVFLLKAALREQLAGEKQDQPLLRQELAEFDSRIDALALLAFDIYQQCREQIFDIRVREAKSRSESAGRARERGKVR
jgi:hypothetical protein